MATLMMSHNYFGSRGTGGPLNSEVVETNITRRYIEAVKSGERSYE